MELFGLSAHVRDVCERLAGLGYLALAPDLYHRSAPGVEPPNQPQDRSPRRHGPHHARYPTHSKTCGRVRVPGRLVAPSARTTNSKRWICLGGHGQLAAIPGRLTLGRRRSGSLRETTANWDHVRHDGESVSPMGADRSGACCIRRAAGGHVVCRMLGLVEHVRVGQGHRVQLGFDGERAQLIVRELGDKSAPRIPPIR